MSSGTERKRVAKNSTRANGQTLIHEFEPASEEVTLRHLGQNSLEFTDISARVISGTVSHGGFAAAYFATDCPPQIHITLA